MKNKIEYYLKLPYTRELVPEPEGGWFVRIKELPGCMSQGDTPEEAMEMIADAMHGWLEVELEHGHIIPEPRLNEEYSGKFVTRVPKSIHRKLVAAAEDDGVSLNQWIVAALAEALGSTSAPRIEQQTAEALPMQALSDAIHNILQDVGMRLDNSLSDETCFANWLESNFEDVQSNYQESDFGQSLERIQALADTLREYQNESPLIRVLYRLAENQVQIIKKTIKINQRAVNGERFQSRIRELMVSMYLSETAQENLFEEKGARLWDIQKREIEKLTIDNDKYFNE